VQKAFARLFYNDFLRDSDATDFSSLQSFKNITHEESLKSRDLEKAVLALSKEEFTKKVSPSIEVAEQVGNMYCASLYGCLVSLLSNVPDDDLVSLHKSAS
jgi:hydroxymethylglutaryl-CoA synthase